MSHQGSMAARHWQERVGENPIDFAFVLADVLWLVVLRTRPVSFVSISGTFHV